MTSISRPTAKDGPVSDERAELEALRAEVAAWRAKFGKSELRDIAFTNSAKEVDALYTALDVSAESAEALSVPGQYPFTRGIHPTGYRGKLWTMRQFAGFGSPKETNERYK
jgi:methylmalonyl-CoA mutase N-terminal domain/subunit